MKKVVLIVILVLAGSCTKKDYEVINTDNMKIIINKNIAQNPGLKIKFSKISTITDSLLFPVSLVYSKNHIFINDFKLNRILKFNIDGKFSTSFGGIGSGPGEYQGQPQLCLKKDTICIISEDRRALKYDLEGKYLKTIKIKDYPVQVMNIANSNSYIGIAIKFEEKEKGILLKYNLNLYNSNLEKYLTIKSNELLVKDIREFDITEGLNSYCIDQNKIYIANKSKDSKEVEAYDFEGKRVLKISSSYRKVKYTEKEIADLNDYFFKVNGGVKVSLDKDYKYSIQAIYTDYNDNLWLVSPNASGKFNIEIYKKGILQNIIPYPKEFPARFIGQKVFVCQNYVFVIEDDFKINIYKYVIVEEGVE